MSQSRTINGFGRPTGQELFTNYGLTSETETLGGPVYYIGNDMCPLFNEDYRTTMRDKSPHMCRIPVHMSRTLICLEPPFRQSWSESNVFSSDGIYHVDKAYGYIRGLSSATEFSGNAPWNDIKLLITQHTDMLLAHIPPESSQKGIGKVVIDATSSAVINPVHLLQHFGPSDSCPSPSTILKINTRSNYKPLTSFPKRVEKGDDHDVDCCTLV
ncbi:hypothetical protein Tco_0748153 [Tanacetum coccineum]|uniref:Uncharacterized protein n=1 Tax=Tanacetum coccineum TaxID=301880 RepID=A0ABQ4YXT5_9ASTR